MVTTAVLVNVSGAMCDGAFDVVAAAHRMGASARADAGGGGDFSGFNRLIHNADWVASQDAIKEMGNGGKPNSST